MQIQHRHCFPRQAICDFTVYLSHTQRRKNIYIYKIMKVHVTRFDGV